MKEYQLILISLFGSLMIHHNSSAQDFKGLNKEDLRNQLSILIKEKDSLNILINGLRKDSTNMKSEIRIGVEEVNKLTNENLGLLKKIELLEIESELMKISIDSLNNILNNSVAVNETNCFDFKYDYLLFNGGFPPSVIPIGWSIDGKFSYRQVYCNSGCGCCDGELVVLDTKTKKEIYRIDEDSLSEIHISRKADYLNYYAELQNKINPIFINHNIIPFDIGQYIPFKNCQFIENTDEKYGIGYSINSVISDSISITLDARDGFYKITVKHRNRIILSDERDLMMGDGDIPPETVDLGGYFVSPYDETTYIIALIIRTSGHEFEANYIAEFVGFQY